MVRKVFGEFKKYLKLGDSLAALYKSPIDPNYRATIAEFIKNPEPKDSFIREFNLGNSGAGLAASLVELPKFVCDR